MSTWLPDGAPSSWPLAATCGETSRNACSGSSALLQDIREPRTSCPFHLPIEPCSRPLPYQVSPLRAGFPNTAFGVSSSVHHRLLSSAAEGSQIGSHQHLCQRAVPAEEGCPTTAQCRSTEARASCDSPSGVTLTDRPWWRPVGHSAGCRPQRSAPTDRRSGRCEVGRWPRRES